MRILVYFFLLISTVFFSYCKKSPDVTQITPDPKSGEYNLDGSPKFLKGISVQGSEKIAFDSASRDFVITLPKSYSEENIDLHLSLYKDIKIEYGTPSVKSDTIIRFTYKGSAPLRFFLVAGDGTRKLYSVYVNHSASPQIELLSNEILINSSFIKLPVKIITGVGTTPATPALANPVIKLIDRKNGSLLEGVFYNNIGQVFISDASKLINSDKYALEIQFSNQKSFVFENIRFKRGLPSVNLAGNQNVLSPEKDTIFAFGGYFIPTDRYKVEFSSDFAAKSSAQEMKFLDSSRITANLPKGIAEGSYLVTFYENDIAIGKSSLYFSENKTHSIETIWQGSPNNALIRNTEKLTFKKGDTFFAKPFPPIYLGSSQVSGFNVKDLPNVRLKNGSTTVDLLPELTIINWAVAGINFSIGKYTLPKNIQSGTYQATLIFPDKIESKPYWSKIEIN